MNLIKKIPIPMSGLMLALASTGNLLYSYGAAYKTIFGILSFVLFFLLLIKVFAFPKDCIKDLENPVIASVAPTLFMGIMILSAYIKQSMPHLSYSLWLIAVIGHLVYILYFTNKYILKFDIKKVFPSYFIVYVGIVAASISAPVFGREGIGQIVFWFGFLSYLILLPIVIYRLLKYKEIIEPALPTVIILTAPANLCLAGYLSSFQNKNIVIVYLLIVISIIMFLYAAAVIPKVLKLKFYPSFSSITFPFVITAIAMKMTNAFLIKAGQTITVLSLYVKILEIWAIIVVLYVLFKYVVFLLERQEKSLRKTA